MRWLAISMILAACSSGRDHSVVRPPRSPSESFWGKTTTARSAPEPFLGIPGLTQVTESTHRPDEWGYTQTSHVLVYRAGAVVCDVPSGGHGAHENHKSWESSQFFVSSQAPLRFRVRTTIQSDEWQSMSTCSEYELPDTGTCRQRFAQTCTEECKVSYTHALSPGTGVIRGRILQGSGPMFGVTALVGNNAAMSDDHGAFSIEAGAGRHEVALYGELPLEPKPVVSLAAGQDADLSITITCIWRSR